ncbi:hypothetical protein [Paraburkholderia youngii]|uniref:hypothetical protein n=1 Tax=Paraburkholderia youngii TaxID=2782701 RepID=UPI003D246A64
MKSKVPVFRVQMIARGVIAYDLEVGDAGTAVTRARDIASHLGGIEIPSAEDLVRFEVAGIAIRAYEIEVGVETEETGLSYKTQLRSLEIATDRYLKLAEETGLGTLYLVPVPRPKKPLIDVGRYVLYADRALSPADKHQIGKIEAVSASGKSVDISGAYRDRVNVGEIVASFKHRMDAEAAVAHLYRTNDIVRYLEIAREAVLTELIDNAE